MRSGRDGSWFGIPFTLTMIFIWLASIAASIGIPIVLIYLVWHFAKKYW